MQFLRSVRRALLLRCPHCGGRRVMSPWARVVDHCPQCRHRFEREEGCWLGAVLLDTVAGIAGFTVVFVTMVTLTWPDVPWKTVSIVTMVVSVMVPVLFYPWARLLWVALDLAMRPPGDSG